jgi:hypothetical protein
MRLTILMFNREFKMTTIIFIDTLKMTTGSPRNGICWFILWLLL